MYISVPSRYTSYDWQVIIFSFLFLINSWDSLIDQCLDFINLIKKTWIFSILFLLLNCLFSKKMEIKELQNFILFSKTMKRMNLSSTVKNFSLMALIDLSFLTFWKLINSYYGNFNFLIINNNFFASFKLQLLIESQKNKLNKHGFDDW